jgi:uncharacterized protein YlxW (UPF0749 family)
MTDPRPHERHREDTSRDGPHSAGPHAALGAGALEGTRHDAAHGQVQDHGHVKDDDRYDDASAGRDSAGTGDGAQTDGAQTDGAQTVEGTDPAGMDTRDLGRSRLLAALAAKPKRGQLVAALLCLVLGFAVAVQVRANQDAGLRGLRQTDLVRILDDVTERSARLQAEARELEDTSSKVSNSGTRAALEEARDRSRTLGILAGTLPARGPGIEFTISDPGGKVGSDVLLDALQELRDAGGEAFEIGQVDGRSVRVVASTFLSDRTDSGSSGGIAVDGEVLQSPYRFRVIGDPRTLAAALDIPGGVLDVLRQREAQGNVTQRTELKIASLRPVPEPEYARPAPEKTN